MPPAGILTLERSEGAVVKAVLYGVGLGPGAPDLITLRAARLIEGAGVIAYPTFYA